MGKAGTPNRNLSPRSSMYHEFNKAEVASEEVDVNDDMSTHHSVSAADPDDLQSAFSPDSTISPASSVRGHTRAPQTPSRPWHIRNASSATNANAWTKSLKEKFKAKAAIKKEEPKTSECTACFAEMKDKKMIALDCTHRYCPGCFQHLIE
jgi:hypothetical protein